MAQNSHNMAIFPHFLAFLVTFLVVRTTFMRLTSTERTQRPVTHTEWWCWTIWTIVKHSSGVGWVQNMAIFMAKTFLVTFLVVRTTFMQLTSTERTQRPVTHTGWRCWTIWTISKHPSGVGGVQNMAIFWVKMGLLWQAGFQSRNPPGNCFMSHITSHYMAKHVSGPFVPSQCTLIALEGGLNKHAPKSSCYLRVVPVRWVPSWNCLMSHITSHCMATEWIADLVLKEYSYICYSIWNQAKICESTINVQKTHNLLIK